MCLQWLLACHIVSVFGWESDIVVSADLPPPPPANMEPYPDSASTVQLQAPWELIPYKLWQPIKDGRPTPTHTHTDMQSIYREVTRQVPDHPKTWYNWPQIILSVHTLSQPCVPVALLATHTRIHVLPLVTVTHLSHHTLLMSLRSLYICVYSQWGHSWRC